MVERRHKASVEVGVIRGHWVRLERWLGWKGVVLGVQGGTWRRLKDLGGEPCITVGPLCKYHPKYPEKAHFVHPALRIPKTE